MKKQVAIAVATSLLVASCSGQTVPSQIAPGAPPATEQANLVQADGTLVAEESPIVGEAIVAEDAFIPVGERPTYSTQGFWSDAIKAITKPIKAVGKAVDKAVGKVKDKVLDPLVDNITRLGKAALKHIPIIKDAFKGVTSAVDALDAILDSLRKKASKTADKALGKAIDKSTAAVSRITPGMLGGPDTDRVAAGFTAIAAKIMPSKIVPTKVEVDDTVAPALELVDSQLGKLQKAIDGAGASVSGNQTYLQAVQDVSARLKAIRTAVSGDDGAISDVAVSRLLKNMDGRIAALLRRLRVSTTVPVKRIPRPRAPRP